MISQRFINLEMIKNYAKTTILQYENLKVLIGVSPPLPREIYPK